AIGIGHKLVGSNGLPIRKDRYLRVVFATDLGQISGQFRIERLPTRVKSGIFPFGGIEHFLYRHVVALPVRLQIPLQILNGIALGVRDKEVTLDWRYAN